MHAEPWPFGGAGQRLPRAHVNAAAVRLPR
jgi:hypothetical protein